MGILILAEADDPCADAMVAAVREREVAVHRLDLAWFPADVALDARLSGDRWTGRLWMHEHHVDLESITAVWYRSPAAFRFPDAMPQAERVHAAIEARMGIGGVLLALPVLWVNRPDHAATAAYKPLQMTLAAAAGLTVADTLITTRPEPVRAFVAEHGATGGTVTKMFASNTIVEGGARSVAFTRLVDEAATADLTGIEVTAHQFQARVEPKTFDARVIVIGKHAYGFAIVAGTESTRLDFRRDYRALRYARLDPPEEVEVGLVALCAELGLHYAAVDFAVQPDGEWVFLGDVNPGGQYAWLAAETDYPLTGQLAELLTSREAVGVPA